MKLNKSLLVSREIKRGQDSLREIRVCFRGDRHGAYYIQRMKLNKILPVSREIKRGQDPLREIRVCFRRHRYGAYYI